MSLVARHLESVGIPTVVIGSAHDIVHEVGVARFVFVDVPLGNPCGPPDDPRTQESVVELALQLAVSAIAPRTVVQAPVTWPSDEWRDVYMRVGSSATTSRSGTGNRSNMRTFGQPTRRPSSQRGQAQSSSP